MKTKLLILTLILVSIILVGCDNYVPPDYQEPSIYECPSNNIYFSCKNPNDARPTCGENENDYIDWLIGNCPGVEILE